jgi:hypothetical protein
LATVLPEISQVTHACNSNRAINLTKQGKMKNLLGEAAVEGEAEGDGAHD